MLTLATLTDRARTGALGPDPAGQRVATVFPDGPHRHLGTVHDDAFCRTRGLHPARTATHPAEIPHPGAAEVGGRALCRTPDPSREARP
ncbi:hypothetical protein KNE206_05380 [Kitasatospora sp. NE20-6]|uniref:hypothetical protein n=1 Tax=Kitasatospora sp. NE20-6 TaxID=2859066 RepID=UPI0034DCBA0A